ncbi:MULTISPECIES: LUD domain-containing protein [unclassified Meiothermus]|uniref:LutC/YkgG family protein n=1 Tax=unclassified Meiothermus TaxID=370471 RepID=UPI000D7BE193|nr:MULTISPECIES: LUD domain-containing protein [unclassified Meiothermus]PZA08542.1 lactate utilization protein B/C [Meiothermus sp. Pnk-1]RYM40840.1 lactate utilization protein B/C [Meiothermus sp. PNK-Is4]
MKERILARVRRALEHRPSPVLPDPLTLPGLSREEALALFTERLGGNGGEVVRLAGLEEAQSWLAEFVRAFSGAAVGSLLPAPLTPPLPALPPEEAPLGISWALGAVAETGSVIVGSAEGRRLQLLPPTHLVFLPQSKVFGTLAEALAELKGQLPSAIALHSGPSRSADIGQVMVRGVHGPGRLIAAIIAWEG